MLLPRVIFDVIFAYWWRNFKNYSLWYLLLFMFSIIIFFLCFCLLIFLLFQVGSWLFQLFCWTCFPHLTYLWLGNTVSIQIINVEDSRLSWSLIAFDFEIFKDSSHDYWSQVSWNIACYYVFICTHWVLKSL